MKKVERNIRFTIRLSEEEMSLIEATALQCSLKKSSYARTVLRASSGLGKSYLGDDKVIIKSLTKEINMVGRNINQMAKVLNSGDEPSDKRIIDGLQKVASGYAKMEALYFSMCLTASDEIENLRDKLI